VHIAFAVVFFVFVGLSETLRHGFFGLNHFEIIGISAGTLILFALLILRGDIVFALRPPRHELYGDTRFNWTWSRTFLGLLLGPVLWVIPVAYGLTMFQINIIPVPFETVIKALVIQVLLVALAEELFFREAVLKAFRSDIRAIYLISGLAFFIYYVPQGLPMAVIAVGAGLYFLTLRLIGTNILVVALVHGASVVMFTNVMSLGLTGREEWVFAGYFLAASAILSVTVYQLFGQKRSVYI